MNIFRFSYAAIEDGLFEHHFKLILIVELKIFSLLSLLQYTYINLYYLYYYIVKLV